MLTKLFPITLSLFLAAVSFAQQTPPIEPGVSHSLAQWRAARYSDVRYKLNLTLEKMSPVLKGTIEIRVKVEEEKRSEGEKETSLPGAQAPSPSSPPSGEITPIILDWRKIRGSEALSTISNVSVNGKPAAGRSPQAAIADKSVRVPFEESNEHLIFRDGVVAGENVIKLDFTSPILTSGSAITRYVDKEDGAEYIYSLFVPSDASTAFPVFDQPDLKARFQLTVDAPGTWRLVGNTERLYEGNLKSGFLAAPNPRTNPQDVGVYRSIFAETKPISTYVFAFAAGPFVNFREDRGGYFAKPEDFPDDPEKFDKFLKSLKPTSNDLAYIYVRRSQAEKFKPHAAEVFRLTRDGIKYLETYFDYKFPFPKYDLVLIPEFPFGGMEHAGATFLREASVIFPTEPTKNDQISRANLIFHETAHQWFGDTVTMKWFDDLWLKEGFAEFMAYKTLEKVMPEANAWKVFYERNKQAAYLTDSTRGTTPIYQEIANLSAAKSAYGNIVYRKAPSFLRQAEFYLGEDKFQTAVHAFLRKHEFANAGWEDLVKEFETASGKDLKAWANIWVKQPGVSIARIEDSATDLRERHPNIPFPKFAQSFESKYVANIDGSGQQTMKTQFLIEEKDGQRRNGTYSLGQLFQIYSDKEIAINFVFPNYQDYGYGIFLLDDKSRDYVLKNIQNEKDDFLRTMMWGSLWDSVRETELAPKDYVELVVKNLATEKDEGTIQTLLGRVLTAMNYYMPDRDASVGQPVQRPDRQRGRKQNVDRYALANARASATDDLQARLEALLIDRIQNAPTPGQRITFYRAFLGLASTERARGVFKQILKNGSAADSKFPLKSKDRFDIVTRLAILGDPDAPKLLADLEKTETGDDAKRYAYAAKAGFATAENKAKYWNDFLANKDISESWIEAAMGPFNSVRHAALTQQYLERALAELPNLKRSRKIFFVNGWLGAFIGGQRSEQALAIVNKFLADNPNLDRDLRLKILENVDLIERAVKIRAKYGRG